MILIILDRDGTIIKNDDFFGKNENWRDEIEFNIALLRCLKYIDSNYITKKLVISNQAGVARSLFSEKRVKEINKYIEKYLGKIGIKIDDWQYCPHVDSRYAKSSKYEFNKEYVLDKTKRKPSISMILDSLSRLNLQLKDFESVIVFGDREEDKKLAENLLAKFININNKSGQEMISIFIQMILKIPNRP